MGMKSENIDSGSTKGPEEPDPDVPGAEYEYAFAHRVPG
jgi:hypothetical protein